MMTATDLVEMALEASIYVEPREHGLTLEELKRIGGHLGVGAGAIMDAVTESQLIGHPSRARIQLKPNPVIFSIHVKKDGEQRNVQIYESIARAIREHFNQHGKAATDIPCEFLLRLHSENHHGVEIELTMMELAQLVVLTKDTVAVTQMGVQYFRKFAQVDSRPSWGTPRPKFAEIFTQVVENIRLRPSVKDATAPTAVISTAPPPPSPASPVVTPVVIPKTAIPLPLIPPPLLDAKRKGRLVPFAGAGISLGSDVQGNFPSWRQLPERLLIACDDKWVWSDEHDRETMRMRFFMPDPSGNLVPRPMTLREMLRQFDQLKDKLGADYSTVISDIFRPLGAAPGAAHRAVVALGAHTILTTNFEELLEAVEGPPVRAVYTGRQAAAALRDIRATRNVLFKIHGSAGTPDSLVLTLDEYAAIQGDVAYRRVLDFLLIDHTFFFVGYGLNDPHDLDLILEGNASALGGSTAPHFALMKRLDDPQQEVDRRDQLRQRYRVVVIPYDDHAQVVPFIESLASA